jgi:hypothetical protein
MDGTRFVDITSSQQVRQRISLAQRAVFKSRLVQCAYRSGVPEAARAFGTTRETVRAWQRVYERQTVLGFIPDPGRDAMAERIAKYFTQEVRRNVGVYFCFGGDLFTMVRGFGLSNFIGVDETPFINKDLSADLSGKARSLEENLFTAAWRRTQLGYHHWRQLDQWAEVGSLLFFDICALNGEGLQVSRDENSEKAYKITFNIKAQKYDVHFIQEKIGKRNAMPSSLVELPPGVVLIKAGGYDGAEAYRAVASISAEFPARTLIVSDLELLKLAEIDRPKIQTSHLKKTKSFTGHKDEKFGYDGGKAYLYNVVGK